MPGDRAPSGAGVAIAWRLGETSDPAAAVRSQLLARCLLEHEDAPLRRALADASGGSAPAFGSNAVQSTRRRLVLRCGVLGCDPKLAAEIEARALEAIDGAARDGLDRAHVHGALARIERELRERHDPRFPFALRLLDRMLPVALYGGEPAAALDLPAALAVLRDEMDSPGGVAALVRSCLRDSAERVLVTAVPDPAAARRLEAEDRARLEREFGPSRPEARRRIAERSRALRRRQESSSGEASLPRLGLDEIGPARERPELIELPRDGEDGPRAWLSRGPTGGLVYARLAVDIPRLGIGQLDDVALLATVLPECGHGRLAPAETRERLVRLCDGLAVEPWMLARAPRMPPDRTHPRTHPDRTHPDRTHPGPALPARCCCSRRERSLRTRMRSSRSWPMRTSPPGSNGVQRRFSRRRGRAAGRIWPATAISMRSVSPRRGSTRGRRWRSGGTDRAHSRFWKARRKGSRLPNGCAASIARLPPRRAGFRSSATAASARTPGRVEPRSGPPRRYR